MPVAYMENRENVVLMGFHQSKHIQAHMLAYQVLIKYFSKSVTIIFLTGFN